MSGLHTQVAYPALTRVDDSPRHLLNQKEEPGKPEPRLMLEGVKGELATILATKNTHPQLIRPARKLKIGDMRGLRGQP